MIYKSVFVDSDVLLDLLLQRVPFVNHARALVANCEIKNIKVNTSSLIVADIHYVMTKNIGKALAKQGVRDLLYSVDVLPFETDAITVALNSGFTDFEDAIQHHIAQKHECDVIISRNIKHYRKSSLPVLTTEQFLRTLL